MNLVATNYFDTFHTSKTCSYFSAYTGVNIYFNKIMYEFKICTDLKTLFSMWELWETIPEANNAIPIPTTIT